MMFRQAENKGIDCRLFGYISDLEFNGGYHDLVDIYLVALGDGEAEMEAPLGKGHLNDMGRAHGGMIQSLADAAMGYAVYSCDRVGVTVSMHTDFLNAAGKGDVLKAQATVLRRGNKLFFCECKIHNQRGDLIAAAQGTYAVRENFVDCYLAAQKQQAQA